MAETDFFMGLDGGGSKTAAVLLDGSGRRLAEARAGRSAIVAAPCAESCAVLAGVAQSLCDQAGVTRAQITGVGLGLNGIDFADEFDLQHRALAACLGVPGERLTLVNDGIAALWGAFPAERAAIVQHGSGLTSAYRTTWGQERMFDNVDAGQIFDLRRALTAAVARMIDGRRPPTPLKEATLRLYGVEDEALYHELVFRGRIPREKRLRGHQLVFAAWPEGDPVAAELVEAALADYACLAGALLARIGGPEAHLAFGGGVLQSAPAAFLERLTALVHEQYPEAIVGRPRLSAAEGAALMAAHHAGADPVRMFAALE
ncbi:MAG TPA: BadF/BadG/BcrA/BcrD ATPase family protein [Armatimonadota bacterium]|jgi:N-acetylglucosamine kinase-like BadF-type ATPase